MAIKCRRMAVLLPVLLLLFLVLGSGLCFVLESHPNAEQFHGAVVSNGIECAEIGKSILAKDGTVADAAIATLFCDGIVNPQSMGLGGGFFATIFIKSSHKVETLIAREVAPLAATEDMLSNKKFEGGLAVAVPGEIKGYAELHRKYGRVDWATLIEPSIKLCEDGVPVSPYLATKLKDMEDIIMRTPSMSEVFVNPKTGRVYEKGDIVKHLKLAETLKVIAKDGEDAIYDGGEVGKKLVEDIRSFGGIITEEDLKQYKVRWAPPVTTKLDRYSVHTVGLPGSGPVLNLMLNMIHKHMINDIGVLWHRIVESIKHAYGQRTHLGDLEFSPNIEELVTNMSKQSFADELFSKVKDDRTFSDYAYYGANSASIIDHGTSNIAVMSRNGDAIVVTSTINTVFGSKLISPQTGIILNDEMDDFSLPGAPNSYGLYPSPENFIKPKKMPLSSIVPVIILDDNNNPRLLVGAAGGSKSTTAIAQVIIKHLFLGEPLDNAVQAPRLHHQLGPMRVQYEDGFNQTILDTLVKRGHEIYKLPPENGFAALTAISIYSPVQTEAVFDHRRPGSVAYY